MIQIATKFVKWDIPELEILQDSKVYKLRVHLNNGGKLNREEKTGLPVTCERAFISNVELP